MKRPLEEINESTIVSPLPNLAVMQLNLAL
jgi:hypothetical protein